MKLKKFSVPYITDERMTYAKDRLLELGYEYTQTTKDSDFAVLPIPTKNYMLKDLECKNIFYGYGDFNATDYNKDETFLLKNAFLSAEGAVALFEQSTDFSLLGASVLITGYGRIGKALHRLLNAYGAKVTVCCRKDEAKTQAEYNGAVVINFDKLCEKHSYDAVFNTVPHIIFTKGELDALDEATVLIDLASFPGGVDTLYAKSKGIRLINGKALPARYCEKTAGYLIGETVDRLIREGTH